MESGCVWFGIVRPLQQWHFFISHKFIWGIMIKDFDFRREKIKFIDKNNSQL